MTAASVITWAGIQQGSSIDLCSRHSDVPRGQLLHAVVPAQVDHGLHWSEGGCDECQLEAAGPEPVDEVDEADEVPA